MFIHGWMDTQNVACNTMEYYLALRRKKILTCEITWMKQTWRHYMKFNKLITRGQYCRKLILNKSKMIPWMILSFLFQEFFCFQTWKSFSANLSCFKPLCSSVREDSLLCCLAKVTPDVCLKCRTIGTIVRNAKKQNGCLGRAYK